MKQRLLEFVLHILDPRIYLKYKALNGNRGNMRYELIKEKKYVRKQAGWIENKRNKLQKAR